jgi:PEP-CTERM motif/Metallo-peptidase family M12B Reprolysin-like
MKTKMIMRSLMAAGAFVGATIATTGTAQAVTIDKSLFVNVYQVCNNAGAACASLGPAGNNFFQAEVSKIWAQAGVAVTFSAVNQINSTIYQNLECAGCKTLFDIDTAFGTPGAQSATILDMFLVRTVAGAYGEGWLGAGGIAIAMDDVMAFNGGLGRIDTIAHEIGHNLGLDQTAGSSAGHSTNPNYLMASGGIRNVPTTINDITPNGLGYDQINAAQVAVARGSTLLRAITAPAVPEPSTWGMMLFGFGVVGSLLRRRDSRRLRLA